MSTGEVEQNMPELGRPLYHCTFSTYRRKLVFLEEREAAFLEIWRGIIADRGYDVPCCAVLPEHVHLLVRPLEGHTLAQEMQILKGASSRLMLQRFAEIRPDLGADHLWTEGYDSRLIEPDQVPTVVRYIQGQRLHHGWEE